MTATNHALTGAAIGLAIANPVVALPLAFLSHFVLDALPHFGFTNLKRRDRLFSTMLAVDIALCFALVLVLILVTDQWLIAGFAAFVATSPDAMWAPEYIRSIKKQALRGIENRWMRFHSRIQWYQKPPGAIIEFGYFLIIVSIVRNLL